MTHENDILNKAIDDLRNQPIAGPPREVIDATLERLATTSPAPTTAAGIFTPHGALTQRIWPITRLTATAAILVFVGFAISQATQGDALDVVQLQDALADALEPQIRAKLAEELTQKYEVALAKTYVRVREELTQQHRDEMNRIAIQTLAASNAVTNRLLADLRDTLKAEQTNDLRSVAAALKRIDRKRIADKEAIAVDLAAFAYESEHRLRQTKGELVQLLVNARPSDVQAPDYTVVTDPNERN